MKKIEAKTLEEAYALATQEFDCSITELDCEIVQHPSSGFLGLFSKSAVIVVAQKRELDNQKSIKKEPKPAKLAKKVDEKPNKKVSKVSTPSTRNIEKTEKKIEKKQVVDKNDGSQKVVLDSFFDDVQDGSDTAAQALSQPNNNIELQESIEKQLKSLVEISCFAIDTVEVDVIDDTAYIFMDGDDAALLIGKEGYRYNALLYLVSNWLQNKHKLYIKLEIAQFLASQQEMIKSYMVPVIEHVEQEGWGRTRSLDGVLVQIALEQLREEFPNKYVAIKRTRNGDKYILINEFNKR